MHELKVTTERHTQLLDITGQVREAVAGAVGAAVLVYVPHTTAGLTINEHADPLVARDFEMALEKIVPEGWGWQHLEEGEENAPSHPRASLMGPQVVIPLRDGELALGTLAGRLPLRVRRAAHALGLRHRAPVGAYWSHASPRRRAFARLFSLPSPAAAVKPILGVTGNVARFQGRRRRTRHVDQAFLGWGQGQTWGAPFNVLLKSLGRSR